MSSLNKKRLAAVVGVVSGIYLFIPEPTDLVPVIGWLDEGMALALLGWSLRTLGLSPSTIFRRASVAEPVKSVERIS